MNPIWNMVIALLVYFIIAAGSYMLGRIDENRKWANIWFDQWRAIAQAQIDMEQRLSALLILTKRQ